MNGYRDIQSRLCLSFPSIIRYCGDFPPNPTRRRELFVQRLATHQLSRFIMAADGDSMIQSGIFEDLQKKIDDDTAVKDLLREFVQTLEKQGSNNSTHRAKGGLTIL